MPERPIIFRSVISPPLKLISRRMINFWQPIRPLSSSLLANAVLCVLFQPTPNRIEARVHFGFDFLQFRRTKPAVVWSTLPEKVIFDLGFGSRTAHGDADAVRQLE